MKLFWSMAALALFLIVVLIIDQSYTPAPADLARYAAQATELCIARGYPLPPKPFTTDGCSLWPNGKNLAACIRHDMDYWCGGTAAERKAADDRLAHDIGGTEGRLMEAGVRIGGSPYLPFPWRWGYGRRYPTGYVPAH